MGRGHSSNGDDLNCCRQSSMLDDFVFKLVLLLLLWLGLGWIFTVIRRALT
jgi:hypothetical protein